MAVSGDTDKADARVKMAASPTREELIIAAERMRATLSFVAAHLSSDEGDADDTEDEFGLDVSEVVEMAHDNMIWRARAALDDPKVKAVFDSILGKGA